MKKILDIQNLQKKYHTKEKEIVALQDINFSVYPNEFISIVGPSGCGKSTILSIISNLMDASSGSVWKDNSYSVSYMPQNDSLLPFYTILDNCLLGIRILREVRPEDIQYVKCLLETYGLGEFIYQYPDSLSGGMKQRCALIRTLALKPDILLLDEPTSALDYQSSLAISEDIYQMIQKEGITAIMVTHDIAQAISMSDRIIVLSRRPAVVKKIYSISFSKELTPIERRKKFDFSNYYEQIWRDLDVHL